MLNIVYFNLDFSKRFQKRWKWLPEHLNFAIRLFYSGGEIDLNLFGMLYSSLKLIMRVASILVINFELVQLQQDLSLLFFHLDYLSLG